MNGAAPQNRRTSAHTPVSQGSTALVVLVPDAEELVGPFRSRYDPVAHDGSEEELGVIRVGFEEQPSQYGPQGAKGIVELPMDGPAPTVINAVCDALGTSINEIPLTPERLLEHLEGDEDG